MVYTASISNLGHLMESVHRLTYKQLYLFKKTLIETGQLTMANTVPVKLVEDKQPAIPQIPEEQPVPNDSDDVCCQ